jgi:hypothetical protein
MATQPRNSSFTPARCLPPRPLQHAPRARAITLPESKASTGFLNDALKHLHAAHESDPIFEVMKLGGLQHLKDDREAVRWFSISQQPRRFNGLEASKAYESTPSDAYEPPWMFPTI